MSMSDDKRGLADLFALGVVSCGVALVVVVVYGFLGWFHVFGLSFHIEYFGVSLFGWLVGFVCCFYCMRREMCKVGVSI